MKRMLVNRSDPEECRIAILSDDRLEEYYYERTSGPHQVGNIYKGVVVNVEPALQAAFLDVGSGKHGFLHASEVSPRKESIRSIRDLKRGQEVVVQVIREAIDHKGVSLTTRISLPGRYLVLMPGIDKVGVSRKITDAHEREGLRKALSELAPPPGMGFILRTAGIDRTQTELARDLKALLRLWDTLSRRAKRARGPAPLYQESDLAIRVIRDIFSADVQEICVDSAEGERRIREFLRAMMPRYQSRVRLHAEAAPLFHCYGIEAEVAALCERRVSLPSGGTLVIEETEALVAIDVNSARSTREASAEETICRVNCEAAREIPRQLRLRDLGGIIVCDFIDMESPAHVREVERIFEETLARDRARVRVGRMSRFGVVELTRQRIRPGTARASHESCGVCSGTGRVRSVESAALAAVREARVAMLSPRASRVQIRAHAREAEYLTNAKRSRLADLERASGKRLEVVIEAAARPGQFAICALDADGKPL